MNQYEEKRTEMIERLERGEYVSSPEIPRELSAIEADFEDNNSEMDDWTESEEEIESSNFRENEEYHHRMIQLKKEILCTE